MKRILFLFMPLILVLTSINLYAKTVHYYVIDKQAMPFQIVTAQTRHSGIVTDIIKEAFINSEYQIDYHTYPFNRMISLLESGSVHDWITYGSPSWGGVQAENLSNKPIYQVKHNLLTNAKSSFIFTDITAMEGKIFVLLDGFDYPSLQPYIASGTIQEMRVKDYASAFRILDKMPNDTVFVEMASRIKYNLKIQAQPIDKYNLQDFSDVIASYPIYLAFDPKMDKQTQNFINQALDKMISSGKINTIIKDYI